jgi:hypothetical protein
MNTFTTVTPLVFSYIDAGTGAMVLQLLIAGLFSGLYVLKSNLVTIKAYFGGAARKDGGSR